MGRTGRTVRREPPEWGERLNETADEGRSYTLHRLNLAFAPTVVRLSLAENEHAVRGIDRLRGSRRSENADGPW
ncbi:hypothetical protein GCM10009596_32800 [Arthrobacter rhombi]